MHATLRRPVNHRVGIFVRVPRMNPNHDSGPNVPSPLPGNTEIVELVAVSSPARRQLSRRRPAVTRLKRALKVAPQFSAAWNHLGTIAYQTGQYVEAEADFRKGLEADPDAYAPLVNLGGVLINLAKWGEALEYNRRAVLKRPNDSLANSQLGMAYFYRASLTSPRNILRPPSKSIRHTFRIPNCYSPRSICALTSERPRPENCRTCSSGTRICRTPPRSRMRLRGCW
jgi:hypothetical protein